MEEKIKSLLKESLEVKEKIIKNSLSEIKSISELCSETIKNGGKIFFCGNGGSAADSQHLAAEFVVRFKKNRRPLAAISLTTNTSTITAAGNDFGFETIFSRQLESLADKKDILIAISTSGKSKNIIEAIKKAKEIGIKTIAFTGEQGKDFADSCHLSFIVPSKDTAHIQEMHICVGHIICQLVEESLKIN